MYLGNSDTEDADDFLCSALMRSVHCIGIYCGLQTFINYVCNSTHWILGLLF